MEQEREYINLAIIIYFQKYSATQLEAYWIRSEPYVYSADIGYDLSQTIQIKEQNSYYCKPIQNDLDTIIIKQ
jgi:hypothetical protein